MSWYSNIPAPEINSLVLTFAHIERCRHIAKLDVPLDGRFDCKFEAGAPPALTLTEKPGFVDLFGRHKINLSILCGKNGVGKTTILQLLSARLPHRGENDFLVVFRDRNGNYVANGKLRVRDAGGERRLDHSLDYHDLKLSHLCSNGTLNADDHFTLRKNLAGHYVLHQALYDDVLGPLFTDFIVDYYDPSTPETLGRDLSRRMNWQLEGVDFESYLEEHPLFAATLCVMQDNTFDPLLSALELPANDFKALHELLSPMDPEGALEREILGLMGKSSEKPNPFVEAEPKAYPIAEYQTIQDKLSALSDKVDNVIRDFFESLKETLPKLDFHYWPRTLQDRLLYLRPFKQMSSGRRMFEHLSSGERTDIQIRYQLHPCMTQREGSWFHVDEPDVHLHPEWKRQFIGRFLRAVDATRDYLAARDEVYRDKIYTVIMTTHSPFLLSDVTGDHALLLDMNTAGVPVLRRGRSGTFAGNIGAMFYEQFFMTETTGQFAAETLDAAIKRLEQPGALPIEETRHCERLFSVVGDPLLRKLLFAKLEEKIREKN